MLGYHCPKIDCFFCFWNNNFNLPINADTCTIPMNRSNCTCSKAVSAAALKITSDDFEVLHARDVEKMLQGFTRNAPSTPDMPGGAAVPSKSTVDFTMGLILPEHDDRDSAIPTAPRKKPPQKEEKVSVVMNDKKFSAWNEPRYSVSVSGGSSSKARDKPLSLSVSLGGGDGGGGGGSSNSKRKRDTEDDDGTSTKRSSSSSSSKPHKASSLSTAASKTKPQGAVKLKLGGIKMKMKISAPNSAPAARAPAPTAPAPAPAKVPMPAYTPPQPDEVVVVPRFPPPQQQQQQEVVTAYTAAIPPPQLQPMIPEVNDSMLYPIIPPPTIPTPTHPVGHVIVHEAPAPTPAPAPAHASAVPLPTAAPGRSSPAVNVAAEKKKKKKKDKHKDKKRDKHHSHGEGGDIKPAEMPRKLSIVFKMKAPAAPAGGDAAAPPPPGNSKLSISAKAKRQSGDGGSKSKGKSKSRAKTSKATVAAAGPALVVPPPMTAAGPALMIPTPMLAPVPALMIPTPMTMPAPAPALMIPETVTGNTQIFMPAAAAAPAEPAFTANNFGPPLPERAVLDEVRLLHPSQLAPKKRDLEKPADVPEGGTFYCACGAAGKNGEEWGNMVGCDGGCDAWFHYTCVGQLDYDASRNVRQERDNEAWICPDCSMERDHGDKIDHPLTQARTDILKKVLEDMRNFKFNSTTVRKKTTGRAVFELAPNKQGYGDAFNANYCITIPEPMDFETVGNRLKEGGYYPRDNQYLCARAFDRDMLLIFDNCKIANKAYPDYTDPDKDHYRELADVCERKYNVLMKTALGKLRKTPSE